MNILRKWPFSPTTTTLDVAGESIITRPYQMVIWASLTLDDAPPASAARLPVILDTGHNHNFSIRASQLEKWAGISPGQCRKIGAILVNREELPLLAVDAWIHRNRPGTDQLLPHPVRLLLPEGISVYPSESASAPRLPLLGLRGLVRNRWRVVIDGTQLSLSKKTA